LLPNQVPPDKPHSLSRSPSQALAKTDSKLVRLPQETDRASNEPLEPFFRACGGLQTISLAVRRVESRGPAEAYAFQQPFVVIGSCAESDLVMPDRSVNYRHIYLQLVGGRWIFTNLARISRTKAGQGHPASGPFDVGCELKVGYHVIKRVGTSPAGELIRQSEDLLPERSRELPSYTLDVVSRRRGAPDLPPTEFSAPLTLIGTSKACDLMLDDDSVSRVHASLVSTPDGLWVVDLLGRGGVAVDGRREIWSPVHDGAVLQIGRASIRVRIGVPQNRPLGRLGRRAAPVDLTTDSPQAPPAVAFGGLSEGAVLALVGQLAEMQNQFFEHSRMQMQWMSQMLAQVSEVQRESAQRDLARFEEITCELREIRAQLAKGAGSNPAGESETGISVGRRLAGNASERLLLEAGESKDDKQEVQPATGEEASPIQDSINQDSTPADDHSPKRTTAFEALLPPRAEKETESALPSQAQTDSPAQTDNSKQKPDLPPRVDSQVWLTERMAKLSQEQNSLWARLMSAFSGK
jgi:hypothetical protein